MEHVTEGSLLPMALNGLKKIEKTGAVSNILRMDQPNTS